MNTKRITASGLLVLALSSIAVKPVLAAGYDTPTEELIRGLNQQLLYMAIPITVLVEAILLYTVIKFRNNDEPKPTKENRRLEISWTIATAIILLVVGIASYGVMASPWVTTTPDTEVPEDAIEVKVISGQWFWKYEYPDENVSTGRTMVIPANRPIYLNITSEDVIHAVHVPELGLKQDAMPGDYNHLLFKARNEGEYQLYCAEYCGVGHSGMLGTFKVVSEEEYQQWLEEQKE